MDTAADLAHALDAAAWARALGFAPDGWQADVLRSGAGRMLLNCARQSGKSTVTALLALHTATYQAGALVLLLSPSLRQSSELFRKVASFYRQLAKPVSSEAESVLKLELSNGSRMISLPGTEATVRGFSGANLLIIDEASRVSDDLYFTVRPMLAVSGGRLAALSTPFGKRGWFWREWEQSGAGWLRVQVTAEACPRISQEFLEEERQHLGTWWFSQEYECEFMDSQTALFTYDTVKSATQERVEAWAL